MNDLPSQEYQSSTPILDRLMPFPRLQTKSSSQNKSASVVAILIFIVVAALAFLLIATSGGEGLINVLALPLLFFPVIVVHELGHLVLGLCARFRLSSIQFGPIQVSPPFRLSWNIRRKTGLAGLVRMLPTRTENLRSRAVIFILGGPAANLLTGLLILYMAGPEMALLRAFAALSLLIGGINLFPLQTSAHASDGKRITMLLRNGQQGERWLVMLQLVDDLYNGTPAEDLSPEFLARATAITDDTPDTVAAFAIAYGSAWYRDDNEAARLLEICLKHCGASPIGMREALQCDAAVFQARKRKRVDLARLWLNDLPEKPQLPAARLRGEAAILEAEGDIRGALGKLEAYEKEVLKINDRYQQRVSLLFLQRWQQELLAQQPPVEP
jgi:hypothetical protein